MTSLADYQDKIEAKAKVLRAYDANPKDKDLQRKRDLIKLEEVLLETSKRMTENRILYYKPYAKQREFHLNGASYTERLLMAANRVGKTMCGGAEIAYHLTGLYPDWWEGRRYNRPVRGWAAGVTGESTRDVLQAMLIGTKADGWGSGMIPKHCLSKDKMSLARGVSDLLDTVLVKHVTGGWSELKFKSYERGQEKWQGDTLDFVWFDEEPPEDIYVEGYTRIITTNGFVMLTFTPLQGRSAVVEKFLSDPTSKDKAITSMTLDDAEHITPEMRDKAIAAWPAHEREARSRGIPTLGGGRIFDIAESQVECEPFDIPKHWSLIWGMDYGVEHPFAAVAIALDKDTDMAYVFHCMKMKDALPLQHATAMKPVLKCGNLIPVAWPHDVNQRREFEGDLIPLRQIYKKCGLNMLQQHAQFVDGSNSTELGVLEMYERMKTNRLKVFKNCSLWWEEYRRYHRVDGKINKVFDDLMSATRQAVMMLRSARPVLWHQHTGRVVAGVSVAKDVDIDPFG